ncbi:serine/threonine-protein kinase [Myxococcaceae bacterium GXIMD 01537]
MSALDSTAISRTRPADFIPGYELGKLIGTGGMGEVLRATQLSLGRTVAVKLLNPNLARNETFVARFQKEAAALAALSHPHIVSIVDKGHAQDTYYLVMEFVDGPSLRERMRTPLEPPAALRAMLEICRAIDYAHTRGVIHRDLKPENILFDEQAGGIAKVTDFGLASFLDNGNEKFALTSTYVAMGTLSYMAPEQRVDAKSADARADIFSLGCILYELLTGSVPLGTFDPPSQRKPGLDPRLDAIVTRCLKPDPEDRYPRVAALIADLEPMAPTHYSLPPPPITRMQRFKGGVRRAASLVVRTVEAAVVLAALGVLAVALWYRGEKRVTPDFPAKILAADLGPASEQSMAGRIEDNARTETRKVTLGEGPDPLSLRASGRPFKSDAGMLTFPEPTGQSRAGRAVVDVVKLEGDVAQLSAKLSVERPTPTWLEAKLEHLGRPPPEPVAALMLLGRDGRTVAVVHHGEGRPLSLEWALGERSGAMWSSISAPSAGEEAPAPPTAAAADKKPEAAKADEKKDPAKKPEATKPEEKKEQARKGEAHLELSIDAEGVLQAFLGTGRDKRRIAEPLDLGPGWQQEFGDAPQPAIGCLEGSCRVSGLTYSIKRVPPPPPETPAEPAQVVPAKAAAPPPAVKRPAVKAPPPKGTKRPR